MISPVDRVIQPLNNWAPIFKACLGVRRHCNGKYVSLAIKKKNKVCVVNLLAALFGEQIKGSRVLDKKVNETQVSTTAFCHLKETRKGFSLL